MANATGTGPRGGPLVIDQPSWMTVAKGLVLGLALAALALFLARLMGVMSTPTIAAWAVLGLLVGYFLSDFLSGTVHWFCDSFFSPTTPIIGRRVIHPFRDHHDHPDAIVGYRLIEQDSTNSLITIPFLLVALWRGGPDPGRGLEIALYGAIAGFSIGSIGTNLFHKWAHAEQVPPGVRWLQRRGLILSPEAHERHHRSYTRGYCVTNGWMNRLLDPIDFFGRLERAVRTVLRRPSQPEH